MVNPFGPPKTHGKNELVGGFNPFEKYARQIGFIFPKFRGENKKYLSCHHLMKVLIILGPQNMALITSSQVGPKNRKKVV